MLNSNLPYNLSLKLKNPNKNVINGPDDKLYKGKVNLNKKKRVTTMKKIIKNERENKRQSRIDYLSRLINPPEDIPTLPRELLQQIVTIVLNPNEVNTDDDNDEVEAAHDNVLSNVS